MKNTFSKFLYLLSRREKLQIVALFLLIIISALLETFVVGLMYPFISILKSPEIIHEYRVLHWFYVFMDMGSLKEFLIWAVVGLTACYLLKNVFLIFLAYIQSRFLYNKQIAFSRRLFSFYLDQPYTFHLQRNTAELLHKINVVVPTLFSSFLLYTLMFAADIVTAICILCLLVLIKPLPSLLAGCVLGTAMFVFYRVTRNKIGVLGRLRQNYTEQMFRWVNQGLGGIKETKVLGKEGFFVNEYDKNSKGYVRAEQFMYLINQLPRPFFETICMIGILLIILLLIMQSREFQSVIPTLSLFAVAAFRIIPAMNRVFAAATQIRYNSCSVEAVYTDMALYSKTAFSFNKETDNTSIKVTDKSTSLANSSSKKETRFCKTIELKNIYYQYPNAQIAALKDISLTIPKNYSIGFVGPSGAGKTTIIDVILGLLTPTQGKVLVDGEGIDNNLLIWQRLIGYVPQNIYLSDDTIRRNIAFGLPDEQIKEDQVWSVIASAQLEELVNSLSGKLDTFVGERGIRLSGGQRQRIGIARALYHNPEILVMDEGTASLDNETEWEIMQALNSLSGKKTIIIIAHRLSTVKNCDQLYFIRDGEVADYGTYEELLDKSLEFKSMAMSKEYK